MMEVGGFLFFINKYGRGEVAPLKTFVGSKRSDLLRSLSHDITTKLLNLILHSQIK